MSNRNVILGHPGPDLQRGYIGIPPWSSVELCQYILAMDLVPCVSILLFPSAISLNITWIVVEKTHFLVGRAWDSESEIQISISICVMDFEQWS